MATCMEYNIVQMSAAASYGSTDPHCPIFNYFATQIRLNLSDGLGYVDFKGIGHLQLTGIDVRLQETPQEKVYQDQIAQSLRPIQVTCARDNHTLKLFMQNIHRGIRCVACSTVLLEHVVYIHIIQFGPKEFGYSVVLAIHADCLTNVVFKKVQTSDGAGPKYAPNGNFL